MTIDPELFVQAMLPYCIYNSSKNSEYFSYNLGLIHQNSRIEFIFKSMYAQSTVSPGCARFWVGKAMNTRCFWWLSGIYRVGVSPSAFPNKLLLLYSIMRPFFSLGLSLPD